MRNAQINQKNWRYTKALLATGARRDPFVALDGDVWSVMIMTFAARASLPEHIPLVIKCSSWRAPRRLRASMMRYVKSRGRYVEG